MKTLILNKVNFLLMSLLVSLNFTAMFLSPWLVIQTGDSLWFLLIVPSLFLTNTLWALLHEGIHSNLNSNLKISNWCSRLLAILLHSNFELLKFGHLMHHRYNRSDYDLTEGVENFKQNHKSKFKYLIYRINCSIAYYFHITLGLYLMEVIGPLLMFMPVNLLEKFAMKLLGTDHGYVLNAKKILIKKDKIRKIRIDNLINILIITLIVVCYQHYFWIYIIYSLIRGLLISSVDNLPHYGANLDRVAGSFNLQTPWLWQKMILNFNFHRIHHRYPNLAWHLLPSQFHKDREQFDINYFHQYFRQWQGVISKDKLQ